jgi:hypothetical protein
MEALAVAVAAAVLRLPGAQGRLGGITVVRASYLVRVLAAAGVAQML